jgi:predicted O-methyltransferase YrrM
MLDISFPVIAGVTLLVLLVGSLAYVAFRVVNALRLMRADLRLLVEREPLDLLAQLQALKSLDVILALAEGVPAIGEWAATPDFLLALARHSRDTTPQAVVECGSGVSSIVIARCLELNGHGHLYSLEHSPDFAEETRRNLRRYGLERWATIIDAPLVDQRVAGATMRWYAPTQAVPEKIDMLVIDGPPGLTGRLARYPAGPRLLSRLRSGGSAFIDDAMRPDEKEAVRRWREEFPGLTVIDHPSHRGCVELRVP